MPIIGFDFNKIQAERKEIKKNTRLEIHNKINLTNIEEEKLPIPNQRGLKFFFKFSLEYAPNAGSIYLEGSVLYTEDNKKVDEILKEWKKTKKISPELMAQLINFIMLKSNIKSVILSQDINLPVHIPMPKVEPGKQNNNNYIG